MVSELERDTVRNRRKGFGTLNGTPARLAAGAAVIAAATLVVITHDWDKMVNYTLLRQDVVMRDASNQAWIMFFWLSFAVWWYTYLLRRHQGWGDIKTKVMCLTPLAVTMFYAGVLWATARMTLMTSELGREALGATLAVGWPLLILFFLGLEWSSRRA